ncbi:MAG: hypothetical protein H6523_15965 [Mycolicibacterium sp.]|jgi:hypothetical protein|uniref:hypothetical protein n=1 Tax=Mycolicibacterium insubricum TaxID=444597 RepID=UPI0021F38F3C|nr:hypothetical protein [Mycolicibacterium insubricum]MCB9441731.1 hypothetical protein [Mycolicibacterium sp.]MCV7083383.1 hypothetical protein [Mycolicibacterium insubricum]
MGIDRAIVLGVSALFAGAVIATVPASADPDPSPGPSPSPTPAATPAASPSPSPSPSGNPGAPKTVMEADGVYKVGTDIVPGNYKSEGPKDGKPCYWKRIGGDDGAQILDNALTKKAQIVTIEATDKQFKTSSCQTWQLTDESPPPQPGAGGILVGLAGIIGSNPQPPR